jgi:AcrR family transcriptional regulator
MRPRVNLHGVSKQYERVARRRAQDRARILAVAAEKFAEKGPDVVTLDQIGDAADIARATLYSHFPSKEALILAIATPLLERARELLASAGRIAEPSRAVDSLLDVYLDLFRQHPDGLRVCHAVQVRPMSELPQGHGLFVGMAEAVLERAAKAGILRSDDPRLSARILARTAIPLLESLSGRPDLDVLFRASARGLLLRPRPRAPARESSR